MEERVVASTTAIAQHNDTSQAAGSPVRQPFFCIAIKRPALGLWPIADVVTSVNVPEILRSSRGGGHKEVKNRDKWKPSKYIYRKGKLIASRDRKEVGLGSRLIADLVAGYYNEHLPLHAKGKLLDLGCGNVPLLIAYKDYVTDITCSDWENTPHKNEFLDIECDLTKALPFKDEEFDTIILSDVLEHIPQPDYLWREMSRILAKDGNIMVNVPFYYWLHELPHDYYRYTESALRRFVETSGLRVIQLDSIGGAPEIMADIFAKNIISLPKVGTALAILAQWLTSSFIKTGAGKKVSMATRHNFPFGYFLIAGKPIK